MDLWNHPKFYLDGALVECTSGPKPVCVALLNEEGGILLNCYVVPNGAVTDWRTKDTSLSSFNDLLACNPVHLEQVQEYLHHFIPPESVLVGHGIGAIGAAFGLSKGEDYACLIDISDWFAVQVSRTLCQTFELSHILKMLLGDDVPDHESGKRDPMLDAQYARMLYYSYKDVPYDHPIMHQARQTLYEGLPKEKRLVDPALTVLLSSIPKGMTAKDIKKTIVPRQVTHLVDKLMDISWADVKGEKLGKATLVFKSVRDVSQMILRLHSNIEDWEWVVKKEGQSYVHKQNGLKIEEAEDVALKVYVHSIPDDWSEGDVKKKLVPEVLHPHVLEVKRTQFRKTKDKTKLLGRTHIIFNSEWCVLEMLRLLQVMVDDWAWTTQQDGSLLFSHKGDNILVEAADPLTWEQLMSSFDDEPGYDEKEFVQYSWLPVQESQDEVAEEDSPDEEMDITEDEVSGESDTMRGTGENDADNGEEKDASHGSSPMLLCI